MQLSPKYLVASKQHNTAKSISSFSFITYFPLEKPCPSQEQAISTWQKLPRHKGIPFPFGKSITANSASHLHLAKAPSPQGQAIYKHSSHLQLINFQISKFKNYVYQNTT